MKHNAPISSHFPPISIYI
uniref:Uncharacterized protein n=1 Tax=Arundo donax TaxID=35708 RepID=A0A0A9CFK4_ARUDO